jgi:capsid protein
VSFLKRLREWAKPKAGLAASASYTQPTYRQTDYTGEKFFGGYGHTDLHSIDYWTLRARCNELFNNNIYFKGIVRRLITNEIGTGLTPESCPDESILGFPEDSLHDWTETVETRFRLWADSPQACDWRGEQTFGELQRSARTEAIIEGDVLVVLRQKSSTGLPAVQLVPGGCVQTPYGNTRSIPRGHDVTYGVEKDAKKRVVAYWIRQDGGQFERLPAYGVKSGRRLAWLVFGSEKRVADVRGQPPLAVVLQSLKEIDRYRDSAQRKAVINSLLALFIKKTSDKPSSLPMTGGLTRRDQAAVVDNGASANSSRKLNFGSFLPGMIAEELQEGEEPVLLGGQGTDVNLGPFEATIIQAIAWNLEIPPEILRLSFSSNYSASQAAINEFNIYLNRKRLELGECFCSPIYREWMIAKTLQGKIEAPGLLEAWRDPSRYDELAAWLAADWYGSIKPSTDMLKHAKASKMHVDEGWSTNARVARVTTGTKFSKNMQRLKKENALKAGAARPLLELQKTYGKSAVNAILASLEKKE